MNAVKQLVSKKKRRFKEDGYDLDLSYVTDNIIAMGYPSESMESMYRNSLEDVKRFLEERHRDHYKVYNLCSERCYDIQKFHGRVSVYPFDDHSPPEFSQMLPFCRDVQQWLGEHPDNVAAIHCKAGKGRTGINGKLLQYDQLCIFVGSGLMICAHLLFTGAFMTGVEVLEYYGSKRTFDSNGVTIPSQKRYVDYFRMKISRGLEYSPVKLVLESIVLEPPPHVGFGHECHLQFTVVQHYSPPHQSPVYSTSWDDSKVVLKLDTPLALTGDVKISFTQKMNVDVLHLRNKPKFISTVPHSKLFHFWVNTFFIDQKFSSELSHDVRVPTKDTAPASTTRAIPRNNTYSKNLSSFTIRNRFAPLSLPDLKAELKDDEVAFLSSREESPQPSEVDGSQVLSGCAMSVRLSKHQIDKASRDSSDRFPEDFSVSLLVSRMEEDVGGLHLFPQDGSAGGACSFEERGIS